MMSASNFDFRKVKKIPQKQKDIVYGYIKQMQRILFPNAKDNPYFNINQLIQDMCLLYLHSFKDRWSINKKREFNYIAKEHGKWCHIFGEKIIERGIDNEYEWKIEAKGAWTGRMGIIDDTDHEGVSSVTDGQSTFSNNYVICMGSNTDRDTWFGSAYGKILPFGFFHCEDNVTITINYDDNTVTFHSLRYNKTHVEEMKPTINCVRLIVELTLGHTASSGDSATMTIL